MNFSKENNQKCVHECMEQLKTIIDDYKKHNELDVSMRTLYLSVSQIIESREHIEQTKQEIKESKQEIKESNQWIERNKKDIEETRQIIRETERRVDALEELATFEKFNDQLLKEYGRSVRHFSEFSMHFKRLYRIDLAPDSLILRLQFNTVESYCTQC